MIVCYLEMMFVDYSQEKDITYPGNFRYRGNVILWVSNTLDVNCLGLLIDCFCEVLRIVTLYELDINAKLLKKDWNFFRIWRMRVYRNKVPLNWLYV